MIHLVIVDELWLAPARVKGPARGKGCAHGLSCPYRKAVSIYAEALAEAHCSLHSCTHDKMGKGGSVDSCCSRGPGYASPLVRPHTRASVTLEPPLVDLLVQSAARTHMTVL